MAIAGDEPTNVTLRPPRPVGWKTSGVDPQALFIPETPECRIVVGRALVRIVIALGVGGIGIHNAPYWLPLISKWIGMR
jgi:hypothetical protein